VGRIPRLKPKLSITIHRLYPISLMAPYGGIAIRPTRNTEQTIPEDLPSSDLELLRVTNDTKPNIPTVCWTARVVEVTCTNLVFIE